MKKINLRNLYPWYTKDEFIEIPDETAAVIFEDLRREMNRQRMIYRYKANYSLDRKDGIELEADDNNKSPLSIVIENLDRQLLHAAIAKLPDKQAKRLYAYFFLDMSAKEIATAERVSKQSIIDSLAHATKNLKNSLMTAFQERLERKA